MLITGLYNALSSVAPMIHWCLLFTFINTQSIVIRTVTSSEIDRDNTTTILLQSADSAASQ